MNRKVILFAIAFVLLVIVVIQMVNKPKIDDAADREMIAVVVAAHDIPPYTILTSDDLRTAQLDPSLAPDSFGELPAPVGLMTTTEVRSGAPVRRSEALVPDANWAQGDILIFSFYVPTSRIVGGQLRPGHHIDVLATRGETRDVSAESLWLAHDVWVVGVYQSSGEDVPRPPVGAPEVATEAEQASGATFGFAQATTGSGAEQGAANLVVVAANRETGKVIGDYFGARLYEAWVYVRPGTLSAEEADARGNVEGIVFRDDNVDLYQQRSEPGLDGVRITLYNDTSQEIARTETVSGGLFDFSWLEPGTYYVEETDPEGYISVTPNRLKIEIADGLNQHVIFGDQLPMVEETTKKVTAVQELEPAITPTPAPEGPSIANAVCKCQITMSKAEKGAATSVFDPTDTVWANVTFSECPEKMPFTVRVLFGGASSEERVNGTFTWDGGSGTRSVAIKPWRGEAFETGTYTTFVKVGSEDVVCSYAQWMVGGTGGEITVQPTPKAVYPVTGAEQDAAAGHRQR